ncbi:hypothetical protein PLCT2_00084 [Planctomycetaceae bacterium]|nr:hypothetical protein PLCT2_00084 [Planctomycetaceae bacterium]
MQRTLFLLVVLFFACFAGLVVRADDKPVPKAEPPKAGRKPSQISADDLRRANEIAAPLKTDDRAVLCGLRYLLGASFEEELFVGRRRTPCPIDPFEQLSESPLTLAEQVRLWAVLETGLKPGDALAAQLARLLNTKPPELDKELAPAGIYMLALRAATMRMSVVEGAKFIEKARLTLTAAKGAGNACTPQSPLVTSKGVDVRWFANHFWRALINRCALDMGLSVEFKVWGRDIDFLLRAHVEGQGWTCHRKQEPVIEEDLYPGLLSMAAIGLAQGAPAGSFEKGVLRDLEAAQKRIPPLLARHLKLYTEAPLIGGSALLICAALAAPEGEADAIGWRNGLIARTRDALAVGGRPKLFEGISAALGLSNADGATDPLGDVTEASLGLVLTCGGLLNEGEGPLAKREMGDVARLIHALAVIEASGAPEIVDSSELGKGIADSLEQARKYLLGLQKSDGSFDSLGSEIYLPLVLVSLMMAGEPRESDSIQRIMLFLERGPVQPGQKKDNDNGPSLPRGARTKKHASGVGIGSFEYAWHLLMLQKYYEKELDECGMLDAANKAQYDAARRKVKSKLPKEITETAQWMSEAIAGVRAGDFDDFADENIYSEYAVMGLKAACALGAEVDSRIFTRELARINKYMRKSTQMKQVALERPWKDPENKAAAPRVTSALEYVPYRYVVH